MEGIPQDSGVEDSGYLPPGNHLVPSTCSLGDWGLVAVTLGRTGQCSAAHERGWLLERWVESGPGDFCAASVESLGPGRGFPLGLGWGVHLAGDPVLLHDRPSPHWLRRPLGTGSPVGGQPLLRPVWYHGQS